MSDYLVPKYLYKASDFISPKKVNNDIAKIMEGVSVQKTNNLDNSLNTPDQINATTTEFLKTVIPESQQTTTTDSQIDQSSLQQLVMANPQLNNLLNIYYYINTLYYALQSLFNNLYNGGLLGLNPMASSLSSNSSYSYPINTQNQYNSFDASSQSSACPNYNVYSSISENVATNKNCCCNSNLNPFYFNSYTQIYANSAQAAQLFNYTNSDYVNNYLLAPPNIV